MDGFRGSLVVMSRYLTFGHPGFSRIHYLPNVQTWLNLDSPKQYSTFPTISRNILLFCYSQFMKFIEEIFLPLRSNLAVQEMFHILNYQNSNMLTIFLIYFELDLSNLKYTNVLNEINVHLIYCLTIIWKLLETCFSTTLAGNVLKKEMSMYS